MEKQDTILDKIGREANIICGGTMQGAVDEAWKRAQNPASLCGTVAKDVMLAAGTAAVMTVAPEVALPVLGITAAALIIEDRSGRKEAWEKDARLFEACKSAWNDPTKEAAAKNVFASELGQQTFEATLACVALGPGFTIGTRFAESKIARMAEEALASKRMVMSDLGHGTLQTRIGNSLVTTKTDGTVIKQFDNGLLQRHIPMGNGDYIKTELRPGGVLTMDLPNGTRMIELPTGRHYTFESNGNYEVQRQSGLRMSANADDTVRTFIHPNGIITRYSGNQKERLLPPEAI